jgi:hypothetical protein
MQGGGGSCRRQNNNVTNESFTPGANRTVLCVSQRVKGVTHRILFAVITGTISDAKSRRYIVLSRYLQKFDISSQAFSPIRRGSLNLRRFFTLVNTCKRKCCYVNDIESDPSFIPQRIAAKKDRMSVERSTFEATFAPPTYSI